ncbi:MAG TPA: hypothetical protein PLY70_01100 [Saprospiraceae bacterium]|nr:hypothetical protein [Saprospiraceae bacterium]
MDIKSCSRVLIFTFLLLVSVLPLKAKICLGCPNDNGGGGSGSGGPAYSCDTMGSTIYVDISRPNNNGNGKTWASAKKYLHSALAISNECSSITTIRVARGTYKPSINGTNRDLTFFIGNNISLIGGYPEGGGNTPDHVNNPTILDAGLTEGVEAYHIMVIYDQSSNVSVKGFRFRNGFAEGSGSIEIDEGINMSRQNGAAVFIRDNANVVFENCAFYSNIALGSGGAIFAYASTVRFVNTIFSDNTAGVNGGAIYMQTNSTINVINSTFSKNLYYSGGGGAVYNTTGSTLNLHNSIVWGNTNSWNGGGERNLRQCIIQDNNTTNGGVRVNVVYQNPEFENPDDINGADDTFFTNDDGLTLCRGSIGINRGLNTAPNLPNFDINNSARISNQQVDLGPYELDFFPLYTGLPLDGEYTTAKVYSGRTGLPIANCKVLAVVEPSVPIDGNISISIKFDSLYSAYNEYTKFVARSYDLNNTSGDDFNGRITLNFHNSDFLEFNSDPYSVNNLPTGDTQSNKSYLRVVKFPGSAIPPFLPGDTLPIPEIIDPVDSDITYRPPSQIWTVSFENSGELGTYFITTTNNYVFNGLGPFSKTANWLNGLKPFGILPSLNTITVESNSQCEINEMIVLKPHSQFIVE